MIGICVFIIIFSKILHDNIDSGYGLLMITGLPFFVIGMCGLCGVFRFD